MCSRIGVVSTVQYRSRVTYEENCLFNSTFSLIPINSHFASIHTVHSSIHKPAMHHAEHLTSYEHEQHDSNCVSTAAKDNKESSFVLLVYRQEKTLF